LSALLVQRYKSNEARAGEVARWNWVA